MTGSALLPPNPDDSFTPGLSDYRPDLRPWNGRALFRAYRHSQINNWDSPKARAKRQKDRQTRKHARRLLARVDDSRRTRP